MVLTRTQVGRLAAAALVAEIVWVGSTPSATAPFVADIALVRIGRKRAADVDRAEQLVVGRQGAAAIATILGLEPSN